MSEGLVYEELEHEDARAAPMRDSDSSDAAAAGGADTMAMFCQLSDGEDDDGEDSSGGGMSMDEDDDDLVARLAGTGGNQLQAEIQSRVLLSRTMGGGSASNSGWEGAEGGDEEDHGRYMDEDEDDAVERASLDVLMETPEDLEVYDSTKRREGWDNLVAPRLEALYTQIHESFPGTLDKTGHMLMLLSERPPPDGFQDTTDPDMYCVANVCSPTSRPKYGVFSRCVAEAIDRGDVGQISTADITALAAVYRSKRDAKPSIRTADNAEAIKELVTAISAILIHLRIPFSMVTVTARRGTTLPRVWNWGYSEFFPAINLLAAMGHNGHMDAIPQWLRQTAMDAGHVGHDPLYAMLSELLDATN